MSESCDNCKYLKPDYKHHWGSGDDMHWIGLCRRYPPNVDHEKLPFKVFPTVGLHQWCGEYEKA